MCICHKLETRSRRVDALHRRVVFDRMEWLGSEHLRRYRGLPFQWQQSNKNIKMSQFVLQSLFFPLLSIIHFHLHPRLRTIRTSIMSLVSACCNTPPVDAAHWHNNGEYVNLSRKVDGGDR